MNPTTSRPLTVIACAFLGAAFLAIAPTTAQKMGHSNTHAPMISQTLKLSDRGTIKMSYTAITWAAGNWAKALQDPERRDRLRETINKAAASDPLGSFEVDERVTVGGAKLLAGRYDMAFMLDEKFRWQLALRGKTNVAVGLQFKKTGTARQRLTVNLEAGDANFTAQLRVAFGNEESVLAVAPREVTQQKIPGILNTMCPLMDETIDPEITVAYKGKKIGMCCEDCVKDWNKLSAAKKDEHLAKMLKRP